MEAVQKRVFEIIAKELKVPLSDVTPEKNLLNDLNADSLALIDLVMEIEEEYGIEIIDNSGNGYVGTVEELVNSTIKLINKKTQA
jgi:acyl carrier protein